MAKRATRTTRTKTRSTRQSVRVIHRHNAGIERKRRLSLNITPETFVRNADGTAQVEVTLATERPVLRDDGIIVNGRNYPRYYEVLRMSGLNTERIDGKRGIPFLNAHQADDLDKLLGRSVRGSLNVGGKAATIRFALGKRCNSRGYTDDIENGTIADTSVGYCVNDYDFHIPEGGGIPTMYCTDWTPHENSAVPVPADQDAVIRSGGKKRRKREDEATDEDLDDEDRDEDIDDEDRDDELADDGAGDDVDDDEDRDDDDADGDVDERANDDSDTSLDYDDDVDADRDDDESEDDEDREDDLSDDEDDSDEERAEKARARRIRAKARAKRNAKRGRFTVLDPRRDPVLRSIMNDCRELGVFKPVDAIRRAGGTLQNIRAAMIQAYTGVGIRQARNAIVSRPDASTRRAAEDGPLDEANRSAPPTDAEILATVRRRKQKLART